MRLSNITGAAAVALLAATLAFAACGGDDDKDVDATPTATQGGPNTGGDGTAPSGSPAAGSTPATATAAEATAAAEIGSGLSGGDPAQPAQPIGTAVPPVTGASVDSATIASLNVPVGAVAIIVDLNVSEPGIQTEREVNVGDEFRVGIVIANAPPPEGNINGVASFNWIVNYDKTKIVAPTLTGGPSTQRNPFPNIADLGGEAVQWQCLPAPEGDLDDPQGIDGDGKPETGQALLSCFTPALGSESGTIVTGVIIFRAIAKGETMLYLQGTEFGDRIGIGWAHCAIDEIEPAVDCPSATITVK